MKKKSQVLLALSLALIMVLTLTVSAQAADYTNHWSNTFVQDAISKGWISADANGNIQPDALATRGSYALMMWKSLNSPLPTKANPFTDLSTSAPYYNAVLALYEAGVTTGMTDTTFGPDVNLTREMACTMLVRAYKLSPTNANAYQQFADYAQISEYARPSLSVMAESKYVEGVGNNMFAPKQNLKNGEMIKIVLNVANGVTSAQQNAAAALVTLAQQQASSTLSLKLGLRIVSSNEAYIVIDASDKDDNVDYMGYRTCAKGDTFTSKTGFTSISTSSTEFTADKNSWYAVCITNKKGGFIFKTIEVSHILEDGSVPTLKTSTSGGTTTITISSLPSGYTKLGWAPAKENATYKNWDALEDTSKFVELKNSANSFDVTSNGWYAVGVVDKNKNFGYKLIEVKQTTSYTLDVYATPTAGGTAIIGTTGTAASGSYESGDKVKVTATAKSGYQFDGWYDKTTGGTLQSSNATYEVTISKHTELYARFSTITATVPVTGVTLDTGDFSLSVGGTKTITATVAPTNATNKTVTWSSSDAAVATVSNGVVTAKAVGTANITATADGKSASCKVTVTAPVTSIEYTVTVTGGSGGGSYEEGETVAITANDPVDGKLFDKWTTSDGVTFGDATSANTSFTMPAKAVTVTATYKDAPVTPPEPTPETP